MASASATASLLFPYLVPLDFFFLNGDREVWKQELEREREERLCVEMMGPGGVDKYYQASMKDGYTNTLPSYADPFWFVQFDHNADNNNSTSNFVDTVVAGLELRVGGVVVLRLNEAQCYVLFNK